jgi:chemotaxis-related protein WspD
MTAAPETLDHCWSRIGVGGDGTCPELAQVIHCRNCAVYARAGRQLFEQPSPPDYLERWAAQLATPPVATDRDALSIVVFRLGDERLALPTTAFVEAVEVRPLHRIPHRSGPILLGVANIRGELQLCVSLAALLGIEVPEAGSASGLPRLAVIGAGGEPWAFPVDEMLGVHRVARDTLAPAHAGVADAERPLTAAYFEHGGEHVALLDAELLLTRLRRAIG